MSKRKKEHLNKPFRISLNCQERKIVNNIIELGEKYGKHNIYLKSNISTPRIQVILHYKGKSDYTILPDFTINPRLFLAFKNKGFIQSYDYEHRKTHINTGLIWRLRTELFVPYIK